MREELGLRDGDLLVVDSKDGDLVLRPEVEESGLVRRDRRLFKPKDRKAAPLDPDEVTKLISIMRDPMARHAFEAKEGKRRAKKRAAQ
ncbi:MAG: hypothetical protein ACOZAA_17630 [Pseudomonadota bacterium]